MANLKYRKPLPPGGMKFSDDPRSAQVADAQFRHFNQMVDELGWKQAHTAAFDYLLASIWWLARVDGFRNTADLMQVCADQLVTEVLHGADRPRLSRN